MVGHGGWIEGGVSWLFQSVDHSQNSFVLSTLVVVNILVGIPSSFKRILCSHVPACISSTWNKQDHVILVGHLTIAHISSYVCLHASFCEKPLPVAVFLSTATENDIHFAASDSAVSASIWNINPAKKIKIGVSIF